MYSLVKTFLIFFVTVNISISFAQTESVSFDAKEMQTATLPFVLSETEFLRQQETVEFLINPITRSSEWGHVSIRVAGPGYDKIYDFGRYGYMWFFNGEGDPILRLWDNNFQKYMEYRTKSERRLTRFVFQSNQEKNEIILNRFDNFLKKGKKYTGREGRWKSKGGEVRNYTAPGSVNYYVPALGNFHATDNNCTTISIDAFQEAFDIKIYGQKEYIKSRNAELGFSFYDLNVFSRNIAMSHLKSKTKVNRERGLIFWPEDLAALLLDNMHKYNELILVEEWDSAAANSKPKVLKK